MIQRSLRLKYAMTVNAVILAPLVLYLLWDVHLERETVLHSRIEVLDSLGRLMVAQLADDDNGDPTATQGVLDRFREEQQGLEIHVLDGEYRVVATTVPERLGQAWSESEFSEVLEGHTALAWDLDAHDGLPVLEITIPAPGTGIIHIAEPQATLERMTHLGRWRSVAFVTVLLVILSTTVTLVTDRIAIRPALRAKEELIERVEGFNVELEAQVQATRQELEDVQDELLQKERLSTIGELAAGLAHEIRNPLQIIRATAETVQRRHPNAGAEIGYVIEEVSRLNQLVHTLLDYGRPCTPDRAVVSAEALAERALREDAQDVVVHLDIEQGVTCDCDEALLASVLINLLDNAAEALDGGGEVTLRAEALPDGGCRFEVKDTGHGITPEDLARVYTPFFSRKEAGIGMGLSLARRIVEQHGGTMEIHTEVDEGTAVVVTLPQGGETS